MTGTWSPDDLARIDSAHELEIAVKGADGTLRRWVPIWVVCAGEQVYVRTWHRRETGWFGHVLLSRRAASVFRVCKRTSPSQTSEKDQLSYVWRSMPPTAPSTGATAARPSTPW